MHTFSKGIRMQTAMSPIYIYIYIYKYMYTFTKLKPTARRGKDFFSFFESHEKQLGGRQDRRTNPLTGQRHVYRGSGHTNPTGKRTGSNNSIRELLLLMYKGEMRIKTAIETLQWLKPLVQTASLIAWVKKGASCWGWSISPSVRKLSYRCTIARYGYAKNGHRMFITFIHRT